jgi:hypothetical protein
MESCGDVAAWPCVEGTCTSESLTLSRVLLVAIAFLVLRPEDEGIITAAVADPPLFSAPGVMPLIDAEAPSGTHAVRRRRRSSRRRRRRSSKRPGSRVRPSARSLPRSIGRYCAAAVAAAPPAGCAVGVTM